MQASFPEKYNGIMPYLIIKNAARFSTFMQTVFEAKEISVQMRGETVAHGELQLHGCTIMFTEAVDGWEPQPAGLFIYVDDADARYQRALDAGATPVMPPSDQSYGRSGGVLDPFGNTWWITKAPQL